MGAWRQTGISSGTRTIKKERGGTRTDDLTSSATIGDDAGAGRAVIGRTESGCERNQNLFTEKIGFDQSLLCVFRNNNDREDAFSIFTK